MTPEFTLSRPEFEAVDLDVDIGEARRQVEAAMAGLCPAETEEGTNYRTLDGRLVAVVGSRPSGSGRTRARLAYRTAPPSESATRKAAKVYEALADHAIDS